MSGVQGAKASGPSEAPDLQGAKKVSGPSEALDVQDAK